MAEELQAILDMVAKPLGVQDLTAGGVVRICAILLVGFVAIRVLMRLVDRLLDRSKALADVRVYIRSTVHVFLWFLLALMVAGTLGIEVTSIIAMLSVIGLAVSLALQNTLSNLAGGLMILVTKPFVVGDYIDADGTGGTVAEIGLAYTKLTTVDAKRISIPNSQMSAARIVNYTNEAGRRVDVVFSVSYDAPTQTVKQAILEVADSLPQVRREPAPAVYLTKYGSSAVDYTVRAWTSTVDYWDVYYALMEGVRESFARHGVEMTYEHLNVHLMDRP